MANILVRCRAEDGTGSTQKLVKRLRADVAREFAPSRAGCRGGPASSSHVRGMPGDCAPAG